MFRLSSRVYPRRTMSSDEALMLRGRAFLSFAELGLAAAVLMCLCVLGWCVGWAVGALLHQLGAATANASIIGLCSFAVLGLAVDAVLLAFFYSARGVARADLLRGEVECISVATTGVLNVGTAQNPAYLFELDAGSMLFLAGRWLTEKARFVSTSPTTEPTFPCTRFVVIRAPLSGAVMRVETEGSPLVPDARRRPRGVRLAMLNWRESELLIGSCDHTE